MNPPKDPAAALTPEQARIAELEWRVAQLDAFAHTVAHQLRAPLQVINGFAHRLKLDDGARLSLKARAHLDRIARAALNMEQLIEDLLMYARADRLDVIKEPVATDEIVSDVLREFRPAYPAARIIVSELPMVHADPVVVRQVFANLIGNALKFSSRREEPTVEVSLDADGAFLVRDNGIGFGMEKAPALFAPFGRMTSDPAYPGTGVGLAIAKRLIERHGGWIQANSREGGPTEFRFFFGDDES